MPLKDWRCLQDNLKLCLVLPHDVFETTLSNFSVAIVLVQPPSPLPALSAGVWPGTISPARVPSRMAWSQRRPYF